MRLLRRLTGLGSAPPGLEPAQQCPCPVPVEPKVPAVAGYVYRLPPPPAVDFHLSARLASVARLNTPAGRCARPLAPARATKPIPKLVAAERKRDKTSPASRQHRTDHTKTATVSTMPLASDRAGPRCLPLDVRIELAAA